MIQILYKVNEGEQRGKKDRGLIILHNTCQYTKKTNSKLKVNLFRIQKKLLKIRAIIIDEYLIHRLLISITNKCLASKTV